MRPLVLPLVLASLASAAAGTTEAADAHLPKPEPQAARLLAEGDAAAKARRWPEAARAFHALLKADPAAVCSAGPDCVTGARHVGRLRLLALPPEARDGCRKLLDPVAGPLLEELRERRDVPALAELARLYGASSYGPAAWDLVGDLAWEAGRAERALSAYRRALTWGVGGEAEAGLHAKAAVCLARLGRLAEAERALAVARKHATAAIAVGGERLEAGALDAAWLRGAAGGEALAGARDKLGRCVWRRPLWELASGSGRRGATWAWTPLLPALAGGLAFVHNAAGVVALDEFTGEAAWRYQPPVERRIGMTLVYGTGGGGPMGVAVGERHVYASFVQRTGRPAPLQSRRRIHALDPASGRLAYVLGTPSADEPLLERLCFCAMPVERDGVLYATAFVDSGVSDFYLLAFDAATGRLLRHSYLFTGDAPRSLYLGPGHGAPLVLADGAVHVASNSGAVACVDACDGSILWVRRYKRAGAYWRTVRGKPVTPWSGWRNAPLVADGIVVVVPCDGEDVLGLDAATGEVRWRRRRGGHVFLHGASRGIAVLAGREVEAVEVATGKSLWRRAAVDDVDARGIGTVAEGIVLCPTRRGLLRLDLATGRELACDATAAGHYVPGRSVGLVAGRHEVAGHCRPEAAIAREQRRVAADPLAAEPRYRLAMALRLAERDDEAAAHLRNALELCAGHDDSVAERIRAAAWRLFLALGERGEAAGRHAEAVGRYREAAAAASDPTRRIRALLGVARCLRAPEDWAGLVALHQGMVELEPDVLYPFEDGRSCAASFRAERQIARILAERGRESYAPFERAAEKLVAHRPDAVIRRYPNSVAAQRAWRGLAEAARREGRHAEAARHYAALLRRLGHDSPEAREVGPALADCYEQSGDFEAARAALTASKTPAAAVRLRSPLYAELDAEPGAPALSAVRFPLVHAWTAKPAGLAPLSLCGPRAPELEGVVFARDTTTLHCLDAATGEARWQADLAEAATAETSGSVRLHAGLLVLYGGRRLYAFEAREGALRWTCDLGSGGARRQARPSWWGRIDAGAQSFPSHAFAADRIFAATLDGRVVCLDAATGERQWVAALPGKPVSALRRLGDRLVVATGPGCWAAWLDAGTGRVLEVVRLRERAPQSAPTWVGDALVVLDGDRATAYSARSGERRWSVAAAASGMAGVERFGSRLVLLSSAGSLAEIDATTGAATAERSVGRVYAYVRSGPDLFLFCRRAVGRATLLTVEAYRGRGLVHRWFATLGSSSTYDAAVTRRHLLVSTHAARLVPGAARGMAVRTVREILVLDRRSGARLGTLDVEAFRPHSLTTLSSWPRHLLSTVHCEIDEVAAQRLVAFGTGEGAAPAVPRGDALLGAVQEGRITPAGLVALAGRHAERGAFEEAFDVIERAVGDAKLSATDYLRLGDAASLVRRKALAAARPQASIYTLDWELPRPIVLDRFRHLDTVGQRDAGQVGRWLGPDDLSAQVYLAYTQAVLCVYVVVRDDVHHPGRPGEGDRLEAAIARWQPQRRQWGDGDLGLSVTLREKAELGCWLGHLPESTRRAIHCAATRDDARKRTTYWLLIPWRVLGEFVAKPGAMVDLAIAVHDADGRGPKGAMRWGLPEPSLTSRLLLR